MKHKGKRGFGEGILVAAALLAMLAVCAGIHLHRLPERVSVQPVHAVSVELPRLNLNEATPEELCALPGIGQTLAERILAYREQTGGFASAEELLNVEGIGEVKLDAVRGLICVG